MIRKLFALASWLIAAILLFFTLRRWLFMILALLPERRGNSTNPLDSGLPPVLLLVPARNEADTLSGFIISLTSLDYPRDRLTVVFIDDGSTDGTRSLMMRWASKHPDWRVLPLEQNVGKARALNIALEAFPQGEIVAIYDADEHPRPDALLRLVQPFADPRVGGVSGQRAISNPLDSLAASYTAFEGLVHQLVTMRGKDRLQLAPAILGSNCAYRRAALEQIGHFKPGALLEDTDVTLKLVRGGWLIRFEPASVSFHRVPTTVAGYWRQHTRWARGFNEAASDQARAIVFDHRMPPLLRLELLTYAVGYLDRLALLMGGALLALGKSRGPLAWAIPFSLLTPFFQILTALRVGRQPKAMWMRIIWVPIFFGLDIAMALTGLWKTLLRSQKIWEERRSRE